MKKAKAKTLSALAEQLRRPAPADPKDPLVAALARRTRSVSSSRVTIESRAVKPARPPQQVPVSRPRPSPAPARAAAVRPATLRPATVRPATVRSVPAARAAASHEARRARPVPGAPAEPKPKTGADHRKYPRAPMNVQAQLRLSSDPRRYFEATLATSNISIGGMFLESTFFLKLGTQLDVTLTLTGREVQVRGEVVRVETAGPGGHSGFALRFTEYLGGSEVVLATHFLSPVLREFLSEYASEHGFKASNDYVSHSVDLLAAWELKRAELGTGIWMVPKA